MSTWAMYNPPPRAINPNQLQSGDSSYEGSYYAFPASGGYLIEQGAKDINLLSYNEISSIDVTNTVQVSFDVRYFNSALGIIKDASNLRVLTTSYDPTSQHYTNDTVNIPAADFVSNMNVSKILSVGIYSSLYSDFNTFIGNYFNFQGGFSSLFNISSTLELSNIFDASAFIYIINGKSVDDQGQYVRDLSGHLNYSR